MKTLENSLEMLSSVIFYSDTYNTRIILSKVGSKINIQIKLSITIIFNILTIIDNSRLLILYVEHI